MSEREEKKNQRVGLLTSVGIHFAMLALFLFVMGWTAPDPPLSEYGSGVELNFGLDDQGGGESGHDGPGGQRGGEERHAPPERRVRVRHVDCFAMHRRRR